MDRERWRFQRGQVRGVLMDLNKWRIKKGSGNWWGIYPPFWELDVYAVRTFPEALQKLVEFQCERYMRSRRWGDG